MPETMEVDKAYWLWVKKGVDDETDTFYLNVKDGKKASTKNGYYEIALYQGWNQIASAYSYDVPWNNHVKVRLNNQEVTLNQAHVNEWLQQTIYEYNPNTRGYNSNVTTLKAGKDTG